MALIAGAGRLSGSSAAHATASGTVENLVPVLAAVVSVHVVAPETIVNIELEPEPVRVRAYAVGSPVALIGLAVDGRSVCSMGLLGVSMLGDVVIYRGVSVVAFEGSTLLSPIESESAAVLAALASSAVETSIESTVTQAQVLEPVNVRAIGAA